MGRRGPPRLVLQLRTSAGRAGVAIPVSVRRRASPDMQHRRGIISRVPSRVNGCDRYGWVKTESGWTGGFLPLQILALARGICDPKRLLYRSGVVAAPTSAGKTLLAELRILARRFAHGDRPRKTVYLVPTREIGAERTAAFRELFGEEQGSLSVRYSDGEHHGEDWHIREGRYDVAVMVNEKMAHFAQDPGFLSQVGEVVIDELGVLSEGERGVQLEMALTTALQAHKHMTVLPLGLPTRGLDGLLSAMRRDGAEPFHIETTRRPVALQAGVWDPLTQEAHFRDCNSGTETVVSLPLRYPVDIPGTLKALALNYLPQSRREALHGLRNNLVFACPTKHDTLQFALWLWHAAKDDPDLAGVLRANSRTQLVGERLVGLEPTQRKMFLEKLLPTGIGVHDADLTAAERQLVSEAFRQGEIAVLFCTSTMAQGINLPAQTIVFIGWGKRPRGAGDEEFAPCFRTLVPEFGAWLGRVGRYGQPGHRQATALYLAEGGAESEEHEVMRGLLSEPRALLAPQLQHATPFAGPILGAMITLRGRLGNAPSLEELTAFLSASPSAHAGLTPERLSRLTMAALVESGGLERHPAYAELEQIASAESLLESTSDSEAPDRLLRSYSEAVPLLADEQRGRLWAAVESALCWRLGVGGSLQELSDLLADPAVASRFLAPPSEPQDPALLEMVTREDGTHAFEPLRMARIAHGHGVTPETCQILYRWLKAQTGTGERGWDVLDILLLLLHTPDGAKVRLLRVRDGCHNRVRQEFGLHLRQSRERLGKDWPDRSPLVAAKLEGTRLPVTLLAMRDWRRGVPMLQPFYLDEEEDDEPLDVPEEPDDIEMRFGLYPFGCSLYERGRDFARLVRAFAALAEMMPAGTFPPARSAALPPLSEGVVSVPHDLDHLADELLYGTPLPATSLARTGVSGLSRGWVLRLQDAVEEKGFARDLPLVERVRMLSDDDEAYRAAFPTHGLAERVREELKRNGQLPLGELLRQDPSVVERFYARPEVIAAHVEQGRDRYTAFRMIHRGMYSVMRRNVRKDEPIELETEADFRHWRSQGAVEVLAEIGRYFDDEYRVDRLFVDVDPYNGYPLGEMKGLVREIAERFARHPWVHPKRVEVRWTGGRGFHVIGRFPDGVWRPVETVRRSSQTGLAKLTNDTSLFMAPQPTLTDPYAVLDLSPVMRRGVYRNAWSLSAATSGVCVPVPLAELARFDPAIHASIP